MTDRPNPTPEDAELGRILLAEMQREGFTFVPATRADYLLTYMTDNTTEKQLNMRTLPQESMLSGRPLTPQNNLQIAEAANTPQSMVTTINTFTFHSKQLSLYLYTNPQKQIGGLKMVWQGTIDAGSSLTEDRELILIRNLLGYFGKNHQGAISLAQ